MTLKINVIQLINKILIIFICFIVSRNTFEFCYVIGKGGFGKVWKVRHKKNKNYYALKEMSKLKVLDKKSEKSINSERELLSKLHNPFIVNMHYAFQDSENLYLVMDLMTGGDLRFHISRHKKFSEEQTRFFICGIIISLEYIHSNNIIHRDIKPENLVLDENGYVRLTDFGIAKENMPDNKSETSGTPGYMSPEVMKALNHSFPVDFFALGVIGYEFMKGERPYVGRNRKEIKEQILAKQVELKFEDISEGWSKESADFINKLLIRKPENRIGFKGINELKVHTWLKYYPWEMLYNKNLPSPFIPENKDNFDRRYCESSDVITEDTKLRYEEILMDDYFKEAFKKFYYNTDEINKIKNNNINNKLRNKPNNKTNNTYSRSHKIIINQNHKTITDINNDNNNKKSTINNNTNINNTNNKKNESKNKNLKNSMKIIPTSTANMIIKNHKKSGSEINYNKNINNNINTNLGGNVSNNVIYINFNINHPNIQGNLYNNNQVAPPKTDRVKRHNKNSAKSIYDGGNTINNDNNNLIQKIGINIGNLGSPISSVKKLNNNNYGSGDKKQIKNNNIKNSNKKEIISYNIENNKNDKITNKKSNSKNIYNSMKDISELKNKTAVLDIQDSKNLKKSEIITSRHNRDNNNITSLDKLNNEKNKKKDISHSYSFKDSYIEDQKKEKMSPINKNNHNINDNNTNNNNSQTNKYNINHYSLKKVILKYHSPKNKKDNITNDSSSIINVIKDKMNKNSRAYINNYNSKNNDLSENKSKTFLNEKQPMKDLKENFNFNKIKNKEKIYYPQNRIINSHVNKKKFFSNDSKINNNKIHNKINRNSEINLPDSKNKNSSFDNLKEKDILVKTVNINRNNIILNKTINCVNKKSDQKKISHHNESSKVIFQKKKNNYLNNNKINFYSQDESKYINKKNLKNKQTYQPTNNLSISSSINMKNYKRKDISNNTSLNINNHFNKEKENIKGYIYVRNNESTHNSKNIGSHVQDRNNNNLILSYKQKQSTIK